MLAEATPKALMRTMGVKGLTLFHLKSHLQKYRLGKQSGKDLGETPNDVEAEKHLQIRQDAEQRYMAMLERACKMLADQIIGGAVTEIDRQNYRGLGMETPASSSHSPLGLYSLQSAIRVHGPEEVPPRIHPQRTDCSTESCLTSHGSPVGLPLEGSPSGGNKQMQSLDSTASLIWVNQI
ncbi:hypothetical protein F0562_013337 [Nyssa sinensis]|uniref:MYB-CC type transcription factor LHEQLE-containing domain-containing protein n=1 Tax=Nyssa sinensis TaxID=561372 RepID=A0A5J4ZPU9_9ASTE|nr:hypothetical protein F0562_013337 [Nyssa sinensis]